MWLPQRYYSEGRAEGHDEKLLDNAVANIERLVIRHPDLPPLLSLNHLAVRLGVNYKTLRAFVSRSAPASYRHFYVRKRSGGTRRISVPEPTLMQTQKWIASHILNSLPVHHCSHAFKPGSSIVKCAARHTGARWLIKLDIRNFFTSISEIQVFRVFYSLGYQPLVALELARLCTYAPDYSPRYLLDQWKAKWRGPIDSYKPNGLGYLPQGAPTSPMLSNLVMFEMDTKIEAIATRHGLRYTRYSDDLAFSTRSSKFSRADASDLIWEVTHLLIEKSLYPNIAKTRIVPPGARKLVLGLGVDTASPTLTKEFKSNLRQHLYYLEKLGPQKHAISRNFDSIGGLYRHLRGLIDYANSVDEPYAKEMLSRLDAIEWMLYD